MKKHGPWTIRGTQEVYQDPWIHLQVDQVIRPDGNPGTYCTVRLKAGVCVIAMDGDRNVFLTREFHYAVGRVTIEGVSGGIEDGETALSTAERELKEELGIVANRFTSLGVVDPFTAAILSPTELFLAEELTFGATEHEGTEIIELVKVPLETAMQWVDDGTITHAPSCVALLKLALLKFLA
jgi:ADP-ribose pyrophosphatase